MEVTVTASAIVNRQGEEPLTITRFATALYDSVSPNSVLATSVAQEKAQEDAAKAAAESLRLALLAEDNRMQLHGGLISWEVSFQTSMLVERARL